LTTRKLVEVSNENTDIFQTMQHIHSDNALSLSRQVWQDRLARHLYSDYVEIREGDDWVQAFYSNGGTQYFTIPEPSVTLRWGQILSRFVRQICGCCGEATNEDDMPSISIPNEQVCWYDPTTVTSILRDEHGPQLVHCRGSLSACQSARFEHGGLSFVAYQPSFFKELLVLLRVDLHVDRAAFELPSVVHVEASGVCLNKEWTVFVVHKVGATVQQLSTAFPDGIILQSFGNNIRAVIRVLLIRGCVEQHPGPKNAPKRTEKIKHPQQRRETSRGNREPRKDDEPKTEHNKQRGFPICITILQEGHCSRCPSLTPREAIELMSHFLAREGIQRPCPCTDGRYLYHCIEMLRASGSYPQVDALRQTLRVQSSAPSDYQPFPIVYLEKALVNPDNLEITHPEIAVPREVPQSIKDRIAELNDSNNLSLIPEKVLYEGHGVITGQTLDCEVETPPDFKLNSIGRTMTWIDHRNFTDFLLKPSHPIAQQAAMEIYETVSGSCSSPKQILWSLVPFSVRKTGRWVEHPNITEDDVTEFEPVSYKLSSLSPSHRKEPSGIKENLLYHMLNYLLLLIYSTSLIWKLYDFVHLFFANFTSAVTIVRCITTIMRLQTTPKTLARSYFMLVLTLLPYIFHVHSLGSIIILMMKFVLIWSTDHETLLCATPTPLRRIARLGTDPLELRHIQPKRNRLDPHPSNLVAGTVLCTKVYSGSLLVDVYYTCPQILQFYLTVNDSSRPASTIPSAWANIDSRNCTIVYPSEWRREIQQSWNYISLIQSLRDEALLTECGSPEISVKVVNWYFILIVPVWFVAAGLHFGDPPILGWVRDLTHEGIHPNPGPNLFGYTRPSPPPLALVKHAKIRNGGRKGFVDSSVIERYPMFFANWFYAEAVDPTPDIADPLSALNGLAGRVLAKTPDVDPDEFSSLMRFVLKQIPKHFGRICPQEISCPEEWVANSPYTQAQKAQLLTLLNEMFPDDKSLLSGERRREILMIMSFIKKEFYPDFKMFRCILGRNDLSKLLLGHVVKSIESVVYDHPSLVKHIPWHKRPEFMEEKFSPYSRFTNCDMSSYEASIKYHLTRIEIAVYAYITCPEIAKLIDDCLYNNTNEMIFAWFKALMEACRASGDTTTALGNALITLFVWLYVLHKSQITSYALVVEGDDNQQGDNDSRQLLVEIFVRLGLRAKLEYPATYSEASFCGMIFAPCSKRIITDPRKLLNRFGWLDYKYSKSSSKKIMELYRGKALCNLYQYVECPIVAAFSRAVLRVTRATTKHCIIVNKHHLNHDKIPRDETRLPPQEEVDPEARIIVENLFNIPSDIQILYEEFFNSQVEPFMIPDFGLFSDTQRQNWTHNVSTSSRRSPVNRKFTFRHYVKFVNFCSQKSYRILSIEDCLATDEEKIFFFDSDGLCIEAGELPATP
jgi:hypothetical protein